MHDDYQSIIQTLVAERDALKENCSRLQRILDQLGFPPGHYYSPIVDVTDPEVIRVTRDRLSAPLPLGITLDLAEMNATLHCNA